MSRLRVVTFNIRHGQGRRGVVDLGRTAETLAALSADVICLQEVDRFFSERSAWSDQAADLAARLGMTAVFGAAVRRAAPRPGQPPRDYGNAVLSRGAVGGHRVVALPARPRAEPRSLLIVELGNGLQVACVHLHHSSPAARTEQITAALRELPASGQLVLAGDFNATPDAAEMRLVRDRLTDCWPAVARGRGASFPSRLPLRRLDYVFASAGLTPRRAAVVASSASDHRPVLVDLDVPAPA